MNANILSCGTRWCAPLIVVLASNSSVAAQCEPDLLVPNPAAPGFGAAVAVSGAEALVGAPFDSGAGGDFGSAILFKYRGGLWTQADRLAPNIPPTFGQFGQAVAMDGDAVLVGAPYSPSGSGSAFFFERGAGVWSQVLSVSGGDFFGWSVDIDGGTAIVGGLFDGTSGYCAVYRRGVSNWVLQQNLHADVPVGHDEFGWSVAVSSPWALVGAPRQNLGASGSAYVFLESAGTWTRIAELTPSDGIGGEDFGTSVALDGQRALIGCGDLGGAYVYEYSGGSWGETIKLTAPGGIDGQVGLDGDTALVGANIFEYATGSWSQVALLSTAAGPHSGQRGALDGNSVVLAQASEVLAFQLDECLCGLSSYCVLSPNSAGPGAEISASGSTSVSANDLQLHVSGSVPGTIGAFFYGSDQTQVVFGNGFRCVASGQVTGLFRLNPPLIVDGAGNLSRALDLSAPPASGGAGMITAGSSWNFQFYFRDVPAGGAAFNLSDGMRVTFCP
ncbi:MAG TPA: hypothetical protein EYF98_05020 [Planctomycetes bacterium]|nr:hypothetical protein [Planctomycetota bacterium]